MNRRSFFGFFPAAIAGVALGVPAVKTAWGDGIPKILADMEREHFWRSVRLRLERAPALGEYIDSRLRIDVDRLAKVQAELAKYPSGAIVT